MVAKWKREYLAGLHGGCDQAVLLPVSVPEDVVADVTGEVRCVANAAEPTGNIEIEVNGALVRLNGTVDASQLRLVLRCLKSS